MRGPKRRYVIEPHRSRQSGLAISISAVSIPDASLHPLPMMTPAAIGLEPLNRCSAQKYGHIGP
jgi:hypothetical protein